MNAALSIIGEHRSGLPEYGRLVGVTHGAQRPIAYIVAVKEPEKPVQLIKRVIADPSALVEDRGGVSNTLLRSIDLSSGQHVRADRV
jgi:hypothetical protein